MLCPPDLSAVDLRLASAHTAIEASQLFKQELVRDNGIAEAMMLLNLVTFCGCWRDPAFRADLISWLWRGQCYLDVNPARRT